MASSSPNFTVGIVSLLGLVVTLPSAVSLPPHNWDCVMCKTNTMLAGNFAINNPNFNNTCVKSPHVTPHRVARAHPLAFARH